MAKNVGDRVKLSKALSWLLRHGAEKEGFTFIDGGYLRHSQAQKI